MNCLYSTAKRICNPTLLYTSNITNNKWQNIPSLSGVFITRNTFILKRRYPARLTKLEGHPKRFKAKNYIYDLEENTEIKKSPPVKVILKKFIEGLGQKGEIVSVKKSVAYNKLLLPGLADYASTEVIEAAEKALPSPDEPTSSSLFAPMVAAYLDSFVLSVVMNKETEWTIEPWHIRISFRKAGVNVPDNCITLPEKPISGPNLKLEKKEFIVKVTINNMETANVRCRLHHWSTNIGDRLPYEKYHWSDKAEPIFPNSSEISKTSSITSNSPSENV